MMRNIAVRIILAGFLAGCAAAPLRPALQENLHVPAGGMEGSEFTGIRYPFRVAVPSHWKMTTEFPDFLEKLGYARPLPTDKERTELYAFNPRTNSNLQIDITPASPRAVFSQRRIELLASDALESLRSELDEQHGKGVISLKIGPTEPAALKGVAYAAKRHVSYTIENSGREQGWIYGFREPYQIFILYLVMETDGSDDRSDIRKIVESFEWIKTE